MSTAPALNPVDLNAAITTTTTNGDGAAAVDMKKTQQLSDMPSVPVQEAVVNQDESGNSVAKAAEGEHGVATTEEKNEDDCEEEEDDDEDDDDMEHDMDEDETEEDKAAEEAEIDPSNILPRKTRGVKIDFSKVDPETMGMADDDDVEADPDVVMEAEDVEMA
ncbi:hypothetical protein HK101_001199 [Irineochytrium annulatum]|nr:hypothetical protein HK101_001199 [Irineochytrium annulatum]